MKPNTNSSNKVTIKIPRPLYQKLSQVIDGSGYNSVTDFIVYIMRDLVASHETATGNSTVSGDVENVKKRLRALGYLQ